MEPTKPDDNPYLISIGTRAGCNLVQASSKYVLLIGRNAGRKVEEAEYVIIIGDDVYGTNKSNQVIISDQLPILPDVFLPNFLDNYVGISNALTKEFSKKMGTEDIRKARIALEKLFLKSKQRLDSIMKNEFNAADKKYAADNPDFTLA